MECKTSKRRAHPRTMETAELRENGRELFGRAVSRGVQFLTDPRPP